MKNPAPLDREPGAAGFFRTSLCDTRVVWLAAIAIFVAVFVVAHQRFGSTHEPAAFGTLVGALFVWCSVLPWLAAWWLAAAGFGSIMRALASQNAATLRLAIGGAVLMLLTWLIALFTFHAAVMAALLLVGIAFWLASHRRAILRCIREPDASRAIPDTRPLACFALACAAPIALLAVAVTLPTGSLWATEAFGYDVLSYHLNLPKQWLTAGAMIETQHDVYGYLPNLVETTFGLFMSLRGSTPDAVYLAQAFHATWAVLAAWLMGEWVWRYSNSLAAGAIAAGAVLAVPWVLITGSMAYNEMVVVALASAAAWLALDSKAQSSGWKLGGAIGLVVGVATLAKLTAGFMVAVPIGLMLLATRRWSAGVVAAGVGAFVLAAFLIRNAAWTGNPVFPFATEMFGLGHWTPDLAERWNDGHGLAEGVSLSVTSLLRQWFLNAGYGSIGGWTTPLESQNIARFPREYGFPAFWGSVIVATILYLRSCSTPNSESRKQSVTIALLLLGWIAIQILSWYFVTHQQSRFLITSVVPGVLLLGVGLGSLPRYIRVIWGGLLIAALSGLSLGLLWSQTMPGLDRTTNSQTPLPPWFLSDAFATQNHPFHPSHHPINGLPKNAKVMLIADTSRLFYLSPNLVYASAFDASPLGPVLDGAAGDDQRAADLLQEQGVTHLWVGWSELRRLHGTYGHDERVTETTVAALVRDWQAVQDLGGSTLFAVPSP